MPPKKRGRPPATATPSHSTKRVRVGETSIIGTNSSTEVTEAGRSKRSSAAEPNNNTKRAKTSHAEQAENKSPTSTMKTANTSEPVRKRKRKGASKLFGKRKPSVTANAEAEVPGLSKPKRGRPKTVKAIVTPAVQKKTTMAEKRGPGRPRKNVAEVKTTKAAAAKRKTPKGLANHEVNGDGDDEDIDATPNGTSNPLEDDEEAEVTKSGRQYWLMKAEPESRTEKGMDVKFSIDDLKASRKAEAWDGVRNFAARNNMRAMRKGDLAFFYHSNCKTPGIVGVMKITGEHQNDETAFDPRHPYYDPKSSPENPRWDVVFVRFVDKFPAAIKLTNLRSFAKSGGTLEKMQLLKQGRLSVSAVKPKEWVFILSLAGAEPSRYEKDAEQIDETSADEDVNREVNGEDSKVGVEELVDDEAAEAGDEGEADEGEMGDVDSDSSSMDKDGNANGESETG